MDRASSLDQVLYSAQEAIRFLVGIGVYLGDSSGLSPVKQRGVENLQMTPPLVPSPSLDRSMPHIFLLSTLNIGPVSSKNKRRGQGDSGQPALTEMELCQNITF